MEKKEHYKVGPSHQEPVKGPHAHPDTFMHQGLDPPTSEMVLEASNINRQRKLAGLGEHEPHEAMTNAYDEKAYTEADIKRSLPSDHFVKYGSKLEDHHHDGRR